MKLGKHDMTRSPIRGKEARSGSKGAWSCAPIFGVDLKSHPSKREQPRATSKVSKHIFDSLLFGVSKQGFKELGA